MIPISLDIEGLKKYWLHVSLLACFTAAVALLVFLDYFNLESITLFNERGFYFDYTWKGRLFLLFFMWLFVLETSINLKTLEKDWESSPKNLFKTLAIFVCAIIPLIYIISVNFLGFDQTILNIGEALRGEYWRSHSIYWRLILEGDWPLVLEYTVFTVSFLATVLLAYGKVGLKTFSITLALVAGMSVMYMIDTIYPYGVFKPLQMLTLPTAACAAALLEIMGYNFTLAFSPTLGSTPIIRMFANGSTNDVSIAWPCAGVHSLFLYTLIVLLLFRRATISSYRKAIYFIIGAAGTYFVNILRITTYFVLLADVGKSAAQTFHDIYGELYAVLWILFYIFLITVIQKFSLVEKTIQKAHSLRNFLGRKKASPLS